MVALSKNVVDALDALPLVAILRGITPAEVPAVADELIAAGFRMIEVPLNSPDPFRSIATLVSRCPTEVLVGAGTVLRCEEVDKLADTGAQLMVTPNTDVRVVSRATELGLISAIGCLTPSEAFTAVSHGASLLKVFPAGRLAPAYASDIKAVLPNGTRVLAVGGIAQDTMPAYVAGGYDGFGLGSGLYTAGRPASEVGLRAREYVAAYRKLRT